MDEDGDVKMKVQRQRQQQQQPRHLHLIMNHRCMSRGIYESTCEILFPRPHGHSRARQPTLASWSRGKRLM
jgi:hypothetical protein